VSSRARPAAVSAQPAAAYRAYIDDRREREEGQSATLPASDGEPGRLIPALQIAAVVVLIAITCVLFWVALGSRLSF
jgi:hypothetical protein